MVNCGLRAAFVWLCKPQTIKDCQENRAQQLVCVAVEKNPSLSGMYSLVLEIFRKHARSRLTGTST